MYKTSWVDVILRLQRLQSLHRLAVCLGHAISSVFKHLATLTVNVLEEHFARSINGFNKGMAKGKGSTYGLESHNPNHESKQALLDTNQFHYAT